MKRDTQWTIIIISMGVLLIGQYFFYNARIRRLKRELSIEAIKTEFALSRCAGDDTPFDSVQVQSDTVKFYKKDSFAGMTTIITE